MRLTRIYVDTPLTAGALVELPKDCAVHLAKVLRIRADDQVILFNGDGTEYSCEIETVRGGRVTAAVGPTVKVDRESPLVTTLVQSVPRGDRMDFIMQKATELGVTRIVPVLSQRSVVRLAAEQRLAKVAHWRAVVISACEQCGRNRLPIVEMPRPLLEFLGAASTANVRFVLDPDDRADESPGTAAVSAEIAIGPEGGFTDEELEAMRGAGFVRLKLGPRILRTETAALVALAWLQSRSGDMTGTVLASRP